MRRSSSLALLTAVLALPLASAQTSCPSGYSNVTATKLGAEVPLPTGILIVTATDASEDQHNFSIPAGGVHLMKEKRIPIVNGALTLQLCVPRSDQASFPIGYHFVARDTSPGGGNAVVLDAPDVGIITDTFSLDTYDYKSATPYSLNTSAQSAQGITGLTGDVTAAGGGSQSATVVRVNGTSVPTNTLADQVFGAVAPAVGGWLTLPDCADPSKRIGYSVATHSFSCATTNASTINGAPIPSSSKLIGTDANGKLVTPSSSDVQSIIGPGVYSSTGIRTVALTDNDCTIATQSGCTVTGPPLDSTGEYIFSGTLTRINGNRNIILPTGSGPRTLTIQNNTVWSVQPPYSTPLVGFALSVGTAGGSQVQLLSGMTMTIYTLDGVNYYPSPGSVSTFSVDAMPDVAIEDKFVHAARSCPGFFYPSGVYPACKIVFGAGRVYEITTGLKMSGSIAIVDGQYATLHVPATSCVPAVQYTESTNNRQVLENFFITGAKNTDTPCSPGGIKVGHLGSLLMRNISVNMNPNTGIPVMASTTAGSTTVTLSAAPGAGSLLVDNTLIGAGIPMNDQISGVSGATLTMRYPAIATTPNPVAMTIATYDVQVVGTDSSVFDNLQLGGSSHQLEITRASSGPAAGFSPNGTHFTNIHFIGAGHIPLNIIDLGSTNNFENLVFDANNGTYTPCFYVGGGYGYTGQGNNIGHSYCEGIGAAGNFGYYGAELHGFNGVVSNFHDQLSAPRATFLIDGPNNFGAIRDANFGGTGAYMFKFTGSCGTMDVGKGIVSQGFNNYLDPTSTCNPATLLVDPVTAGSGNLGNVDKITRNDATGNKSTGPNLFAQLDPNGRGYDIPRFLAAPDIDSNIDPNIAGGATQVDPWGGYHIRCIAGRSNANALGVSSSVDLSNETTLSCNGVWNTVRGATASFANGAIVIDAAGNMAFGNGQGIFYNNGGFQTNGHGGFLSGMDSTDIGQGDARKGKFTEVKDTTVLSAPIVGTDSNGMLISTATRFSGGTPNIAAVQGSATITGVDANPVITFTLTSPSTTGALSTISYGIPAITTPHCAWGSGDSGDYGRAVYTTGDATTGFTLNITGGIPAGTWIVKGVCPRF